MKHEKELIQTANFVFIMSIVSTVVMMAILIGDSYFDLSKLGTINFWLNLVYVQGESFMVSYLLLKIPLIFFGVKDINKEKWDKISFIISFIFSAFWGSLFHIELKSQYQAKDVWLYSLILVPITMFYFLFRTGIKKQKIRLMWIGLISLVVLILLWGILMTKTVEGFWEAKTPIIS